MHHPLKGLSQQVESEFHYSGYPVFFVVLLK